MSDNNRIPPEQLQHLARANFVNAISMRAMKKALDPKTAPEALELARREVTSEWLALGWKVPT